MAYAWLPCRYLIHLLSLFSKYIGDLLCDRPCTRDAGDAAGSHRTILTLSEFPAWSKSILVPFPCISQLGYREPSAAPFKSTWAEQVAHLRWDQDKDHRVPQSTTVRSVVAEMAYVSTKVSSFHFLGRQLPLWTDAAMWLNPGQWKADERNKCLF